VSKTRCDAVVAPPFVFARVADMSDRFSTTPFEVLAEYERRSLEHAAGAPELVDAPGLWRGIGFRIGDRHFVSSIAEVNEILTPPAVTLVPGAKSWLLGVANVRGNLVPVVDLRDFIGASHGPNTDTTRVLVVRQHGGSVGLMVDEVHGQRSFSEEQLSKAVGESDEKYVHYVGENVQLGEVLWGLFSMAALVRSTQFQQAAA
jgi:twitching motility protein PilI